MNLSMKKSVRIFVLIAMVASLIFGLTIKPQGAEAASKTTYIQVLGKDTTVMDNSAGKGKPLAKVGTLKANQVFPATSYGNWWKIQYGKDYGYVHANSVKEVKNASFKNGNKNSKNSKNTIKPNNNVPVYDNTGSKLVEFATLYKDVTYPIISVSGNWYKVSVAKRIGYVYKPGVVKPAVTPKKDMYIEVTANNVSVMDNTQGSKLVKVGTLPKGQQFEVIGLSGNWYKIDFGLITGFVYKTGVKQIDKVSYKNANKNQKNSSTTIVSTKKLDVIDTSTGSKITIATIEPNVKYPIISDVGNWYKISVGKRISYIYKPAIKTDTPKPPTPPVVTPPTEEPKPPTEEPKPPVETKDGVAVLRYQNILSNNENKAFKDDSGTISLENFTEQMKFLSDAGFNVVSPDELVKFVKGDVKLPEDTVVITFDGAYKSTYVNAYPVLKKYGFKATSFVYTSDLNSSNTDFNPDQKQVMTVDDMRASSDVFKFEGGGDTLHELVNGESSLVTASPTDIQLDVELTRDNLSEITNVQHFAYPFGQRNATVINALKEATYQSAFTYESGLVKTGDDPYQLKRLTITPSVGMKDYMRLVQIGK